MNPDIAVTDLIITLAKHRFKRTQILEVYVSDRNGSFHVRLDPIRQLIRFNLFPRLVRESSAVLACDDLHFQFIQQNVINQRISGFEFPILFPVFFQQPVQETGFSFAIIKSCDIADDHHAGINQGRIARIRMP